MHRRARMIVIAGLALLMVVACSDPPPTDPATSAPAADPPAHHLLSPDAPGTERTVLDRLAPDPGRLHALSSRGDREELGHGLAHYTFDLPVGPNPHDVVRLHRIVRERRPYRPVRTQGAVFMVGGSSQGFEDIFFHAGTASPGPSTSVALHLARERIDVWGVDLAWTQVPEDASDLSFMSDWGLDRDVEHTLAAMSVARFLRVLTRQGPERLNLLGFSYGGVIAYVAAARETQQHPRLRDVAGIIPVDMALKLTDEAERSAACARNVQLQEEVAAGDYVVSTAGQRTIGRLAATAPDEPSPLPPFAGLTNLQAALFVATAPPRPGWHFLAVAFEEGFPSGLRYTDAERWPGLLASLPPYMPKPLNVDVTAIRCDDGRTRIDRHLQDIEVPILYLGAGGAEGETGAHTTALTSSDDVTTHIVSVTSDPAADFGHADLFMARNAPELAWDPLADWILERFGKAPQRPPSQGTRSGA